MSRRSSSSGLFNCSRRPNHDAVVLGRADSISWFTSGGDLGFDLGSEMGAVLLYINRTSRAVITDNVQSARVFEEELAGLGFQLKERPWYDEPGRVVEELGHNKRVYLRPGARVILHGPARTMMRFGPCRGRSHPWNGSGCRSWAGP